MIELITDYVQKIFHISQYIKKDEVHHYNEVINGSYDVKKVLITNSLCINGQAKLVDGVVAEKNITVNGKLLSQKATFQSDLTVNGDVSLQDTIIRGDAQFRGRINAKDSVLNSVEILSDQSFFNNCQLKNLIIKELPKNNRLQRITLTHNTQITGDIIFNSGHGEVLCDARSKVQGKIIGGKLIPKEG